MWNTHYSLWGREERVEGSERKGGEWKGARGRGGGVGGREQRGKDSGRKRESVIFKVRWSRECYHHTLASPYTLRLVSVDNGSHCVVWDVTQGTIISEFALGGKPLVDIQWLNTNVSVRNLLVSLASFSTVWLPVFKRTLTLPLPTWPPLVSLNNCYAFCKH